MSFSSICEKVQKVNDKNLSGASGFVFAKIWFLFYYKRFHQYHLPSLIARSRAITVATAPSIFSVDFSLSGLILPEESVRT